MREYSPFANEFHARVQPTSGAGYMPRYESASGEFPLVPGQTTYNIVFEHEQYSNQYDTLITFSIPVGATPQVFSWVEVEIARTTLGTQILITPDPEAPSLNGPMPIMRWSVRQRYSVV